MVDGENQMFDQDEAPDFSTCTEADVPRLVAVIRALRAQGKASRVNTQLTQGAILRTVKPAILIAICTELEKPYSIEEKLSGVGGSK
jgi:hypothetical protein